MYKCKSQVIDKRNEKLGPKTRKAPNFPFVCHCSESSFDGEKSLVLFQKAQNTHVSEAILLLGRIAYRVGWSIIALVPLSPYHRLRRHSWQSFEPRGDFITVITCCLSWRVAVCSAVTVE